MARIEDLLHRRTDLSTFLVHFTRNKEQQTAMQRLLAIVSERRLRCGEPLGMAVKQARAHQNSQPDFFQSQRVVSFTETPLEHAWMMCENIETRDIHFKPWGIAFTKTWGRSKGINPVWYLDISARGIEWVTEPINRIVTSAVKAGDYQHDIFKLTPYIEQMGPTSIGRKEFWWEREWRLAGRDLRFDPSDIVALLAPSVLHNWLSKQLAQLPNCSDLRIIDPRWGLERIIAKLAGVTDRFVGPWPG